MRQSILFFFLLTTMTFVKTQTTGSFQQSISFDENDYSFTRNLYFYVPDDYDEAQAYKLVVGFRGGPHNNAGQFRDQLQFLSDSLGTIIVCPENQDHFNNQEGLVKQLFKYTVDTTMAMYNIDPDFVYLTGLSYGGRHAVIVSMDTDNGQIPHLRGVIPFAAGSNSHLEPDYDNIVDFAPACICIGLNDNANFQNVSNTLHNDIQSNGGISVLNEIPNVGHTVIFPTYPDEMMECINFIESQYETTFTTEHFSEIGSALNVYPNPTLNEIHLDYPYIWTPTAIYLIDTAGKMVASFGVNEKIVDVSTLANGAYILVFVLKGEVVSKKISILR